MVFLFQRPSGWSTSAWLSSLTSLFLVAVLILGVGQHQDTRPSAPITSPHSFRREAAVSPWVAEPQPISNNITVSRLARRDDYSCGPGNPCSNGACCGASGFCGYGPVYCGTGCVSNCDAVAECGEFAVPTGKTCPLNTCCSEFGFCGTTTDFCTGGCQSNCDLNPAPPPGSPKNAALNRVIGYYESWSYKSPCNQKSPSDMPLKELTHLFYAFAFIEPGTFKLITMDSNTPEELFKLTVDTKKYNPNLKVYIAVGGWTHNDPGPYQSVFSDAASTEANRQKFADNVLTFLNLYGFDGIDIDWEYPGAPDRGGVPEDTENFTLLMKTLRRTLDAAPRKLGITFTIPSSFWYLRWFDMPGLLKYADWTNLMSYDLHGTWDANNPIGAIVQGHTNLTEIKLASQLLWRVGIKPEQVCIGFGFYGRSFQLSDPTCTTPGCPFQGGASPGPCSKTSGVLMYYEIQAILDQVSGLTPVHDEDAAVKYIVWDDDQWVSYDDADTFEAKLGWANAVGFGGSLIWAVDTDDDKYSAMSGLMGEPVSHVDLDQPVALSMELTIAQSLVGENGQDCRVMKQYACRNIDDLRCYGETMVGFDRDGCSSNEGKPVCCPSATAPNVCTWRGSGGDCNGQCHPGESTIALSSWGGGSHGWPGQSGTGRCSRGSKALCCQAGHWNVVTSGCRWSGCGDSCESYETEVSSLADCSFFRTKKYCCPKDTPLHDCHWEGTWPDCADAKCQADEVTLLNDPNGQPHWWACHWGRQRTNCCKVRKPPPPPLYCDVTTCDILSLDESGCSEDRDEYGNRRRDIDLEDGSPVHELEARTGKRPFSFFTSPLGLKVTTESLRYISRTQYMRYLRQNLPGILNRVFRMRSRDCGHPNLGANVLQPNSGDNAPENSQIEHILPIFFPLSRFPAIANNGHHFRQVLVRGTRNSVPDGPPTFTPAIPESFFTNDWARANALPSSFPVRQPDQYLNHRIGSTSTPELFVLLETAVNAAKAKLETFQRPMALDVFDGHLENAAAGDQSAVESVFAPMRQTIAMFEYLNDNDVTERLEEANTRAFNALEEIEAEFPAAQGLAAHWAEAYPYYFEQVSEWSRNYVTELVRRAEREFRASDIENRDKILAELQEIKDTINYLRYPWEEDF